MWKEVAHVCSGDIIEDTCFGEKGFVGRACVLVATGTVVTRVLLRHGRAGVERHWRAEERLCNARRGRVEGRMIEAVDYGELKGFKCEVNIAGGRRFESVEKVHIAMFPHVIDT